MDADRAPSLPPADAACGASDASSTGFRKFRDLLMSRRFEDRDNEPAQVLPGLFIGSYGAANNKQALRAAGVTHVLCASATLSLKFPDEFEYLRLSLADTPTERISAVFPAALAFIDRALGIGGRVLVHCYVGRSRSAALVLAYLMARRGLALKDAMALLRRVRPQARPNAGFYRELAAFEAQLRAEGVITDELEPSVDDHLGDAESGFMLPSVRDVEG